MRRLEKGLFIATLLMISGIPLAAQKLPVDPNAIRNQLNQATAPGGAPAPVKTQTAVKTPAPQPAVKPAAKAGAKPAPVTTAGKTPAKGTPDAKAAAKGAPDAKASAKAAPDAKAATLTASASHRDPFDPLLGKTKDSGPAAENLPPGKAGLQITTLRVDGVIRSGGGMIAVVSNPQQRVYFVHQGDQLYDGQVGSITMEAVSFHQNGKDPFGTPIERDITKQLYPTPGEQP